MTGHPNTARGAAETIAIQALGFLAGNPQQLSRFLDLSGLDLAGIRAAAADPAFLAGVLEHLASDEALLVAFAASAAINPEDIVRARTVLSGPAWEREVP
jgi:hypothetical protein